MAKKSADWNKIFADNFCRTGSQGYKNQVAVVAGKNLYTFLKMMRGRGQSVLKFRSLFLKMSQEIVVRWRYRNSYPVPVERSPAVYQPPLVPELVACRSGICAGPAEIGLLGPVGRLFAGWKIPRPVIYPRISATLLEPKIAVL